MVFQQPVKDRIPPYRMGSPIIRDGRHIDNQFRRVCLQIRCQHIPTAGNNPFGFVDVLMRTAGVHADQMAATCKTRGHPPLGKTINMRGASPYKNTGFWTGLCGDIVGNRRKSQRPLTNDIGHNQKTKNRYHNRCCEKTMDPFYSGGRVVLYVFQKV